MIRFIETVMAPVETDDWVVERVHMHPVEYAELLKAAQGTIDIVNQLAVMKTGVLAHLFGMEVRVDKKNRRHHYEVVYGDLKLKNVVCLKKNETAKDDCPDLDCLVDAVHDL